MGEAFSAGFGMAMGLIMAQYMLETMRTRKAEVRQVIICQRCSAENPARNKFCGKCGQSLYPPPKVTCKSCGSRMPSTMRFCGSCGSCL